MAKTQTIDSGSTVASHRIAEHLRRAILEGQLSPGERIRQEELAEQFGASRLPVREALRMLESDGIVTLVANTGAWVSQLDLQECIEVYKIREKLEPLLLAESVPGMTAEACDELDELAARIETAAANDIEEFLRLDREFHLATYAGASTPTLHAMVEKLWNTTQHYRRAYTRLVEADRRWILFYEHRLMIDAIRRHDDVEAEAHMRNHVRRTMLQLSNHPEIFTH